MYEKKFNFIPMRTERKVEEELFCSISSMGILHLGSSFLRNIGLISESKIFVQLWEDKGKRALGLRFLKSSNLDGKKNAIRFIKVSDIKGSKSLKISIAPFVKALNVPLPLKKLKIKKYKDTEFGVELYYLVVPRKGGSLMVASEEIQTENGEE